MKTLWLKIPPSLRWPVAGFAVIVVLLSLWAFGARAINGVSRAVFKGHNLIVTKEMQKDLDDAHKWRDAAKQTIEELAAEKQKVAEAMTNYESEKQKLNLAETILADKSKNTDAKLRAYDEAVRAAPTVHVPGESMDEQCARAKALGLDLAICQP
jgi:hypothetical protein